MRTPQKKVHCHGQASLPPLMLKPEYTAQAPRLGTQKTCPRAVPPNITQEHAEAPRLPPTERGSWWEQQCLLAVELLQLNVNSVHSPAFASPAWRFLRDFNKERENTRGQICHQTSVVPTRVRNSAKELFQAFLASFSPSRSTVSALPTKSATTPQGMVFKY